MINANEIREEIAIAKSDIENGDIYTGATTLYDLTVYCMNNDGHTLGLEIIDYIKPVLLQTIEDKSGMSFRELSDFLLLHTEYDDDLVKLYWAFVLEETFDRFEAFMVYMERLRLFAKKFYEPRKFTKSGKPALKIVADELQNFEERKYKFLGISLPSRVGKSTINIFFLCFHGNRYPNSHSAMGGHSGTLVKGFYKELLNLMTSEEYCFAEIYKRWHVGHEIIRDKSAEDYTINLDAPDRFSTFTCRSSDATWTGAIDVSGNGPNGFGMLYIDDLVRDRQHSLSPTRMEETYQEYLNKMVDRKNDGAQELMVGTLWNVMDPLERLRKAYEGRPEYKFLRIPALDENDESNFDYIVNGFSSEYYKDMRDRLDKAEWMAKFMQQPFVREGLLFPPEELKYFDGIVEVSEIKRVYAVCDPSFGGGDNLSVPICYELNNGRKLICAWIYDKRSVAHTIPRISLAAAKHTITELRIERTGAGMLFETNLKNDMKERGINHCQTVSVFAPVKMSKEDKIKGYSDYIKDNFEFLMPHSIKPELPAGFLYFERDVDYNRAMDDVHIFTAEGKNVKDDAPDSLAQLAIMCEKKQNGEIKVIHNPYGEAYPTWY